MRKLSLFGIASRWSIVSALLVFLSAAPVTKIQAQSLDSNDVAQVMTIINSFLLDTGVFIRTQLGETTSGMWGHQVGGVNARNGLDIQFDRADDDVEICFEAEQIQEAELTVLLNNTEIGSLAVGENCFIIPLSEQNGGLNILSLVHNSPGDAWGISNVAFNYSNPVLLGAIDRISRLGWDDAAVRKVLKIFAFGGHPLDSQIAIWANMAPEDAIAEMLNFSEHNLKLSPVAPGEKYAVTATQHGTLTEFSNYLSSNSSLLPIPQDINAGDTFRSRYEIGDDDDRDAAFVRMATTRGLNPFRQRIGLWESNYHLAVNLDTNVDDRQLVKYYDVIMQAHESGIPYKDVIGAAAKSAAVARQYGHDRNRWINNTCSCNDDFAREIHQLFYGIFGNDDPMNTIPGENDHHENVTIPQTARMLTDMPVEDVTVLDENGDPVEVSGNTVTFGTALHHVAPLDIINQTITGADAAEKIDNLMNFSMEHSEALRNLPTMIILGLADDNLSGTNADLVRAAWASMGGNKNFLTFIQAYAVSNMFHSPEQRKFFTSFERTLYMANKSYQSNTESLLDISQYNGTFADENVELFVPAHNVFGGQTSLEAADSPTIFEETYYRNTFEAGDRSTGRYFDRAVECSDCDNGLPWSKDWAAVIPTTNGQYVVEDVAKWLWIHVLGSLDNYGPAERAYFLPILGTWRLELDDVNDHEQDFFDLNHLLCIRADKLDQNPSADVSLDQLLDDDDFGYRDFCLRNGGSYSQLELDILQQTFTADELETTPHIVALLNEMGTKTLSLDSPVPQTREFANQRIQWALTFLYSTPYIFAEETKQ